MQSFIKVLFMKNLSQGVLRFGLDEGVPFEPGNPKTYQFPTQLSSERLWRYATRQSQVQNLSEAKASSPTQGFSKRG